MIAPRDYCARACASASRVAYAVALGAATVVLEGCARTDSLPPVPVVDDTGMEARVAGALKSAREAVLAQPTSSQAWGQFGAMCQAHGVDVQAEEAYVRAIQLAPEDHRWAYLRAIVAERRGQDLSRAIDLYRLAAQLEPKAPEIRFRLGNLYVTTGQFDRAVGEFDAALGMDSELAAAHRSLGQVLLQTGDTDRALKHLETADRLAPNDRLVQVALAQAYMKAGDRARAEAAERVARRCNIVIQLPDPVVFEMESLCVSSARCADRAASFMAAGDFESAIKPLNVLLEAHPDDPALHARLGRCHAALRQFEKARSHYEAALKLDDSAGPTHAALGAILLNLRLPEDAAEQFRRACSLDPHRPEPRAQLATVLARLGRINESLIEFERAAKTDVAAGALDARGEFEWGNTLMQDRQFDKAITHYQKSISLDPQNPDAHANLGLAFENSGRIDDALAQFEKVLTIKPDHPVGARLAQLRNRP